MMCDEKTIEEEVEDYELVIEDEDLMREACGTDNSMDMNEFRKKLLKKVAELDNDLFVKAYKHLMVEGR